MQCKICRSEFKKENGVRTRNGMICSSCFSILPDSIKVNIEKFTIRQIFQMTKIINPQPGKAWIECGMLGIAKNEVILQRIGFRIQDLRSVELNFHPKSPGPTAQTAIGTITIVVETKSPHFLFEEPFFPDDVTVNYAINGNTIHYFYSYEIERLILAVQECIKDGSGNMEPYMRQYYDAVHTVKGNNESQFKNKKQQKQPDPRKQNTQNTKTGHASSQTKGQENKGNGNKKEPLSPFDEAKEMFGIDIPYTEKQIKHIRNMLMKRYHPDADGGSEEMCRKINSAYELLEKFVV